MKTSRSTTRQSHEAYEDVIRLKIVVTLEIQSISIATKKRTEPIHAELKGCEVLKIQLVLLRFLAKHELTIPVSADEKLDAWNKEASLSL